MSGVLRHNSYHYQREAISFYVPIRKKNVLFWKCQLFKCLWMFENTAFFGVFVFKQVGSIML